MLFGLINILTSFKEFINKIFTKKLDIVIIIYLDNILIYTDNDKNGHIAAIWWVLKQLIKFLLYVNLKKCWFHQEEVWYLSYMVSSKSICIENKKIEIVK